jgi:hypothetical protein
MKHGSSCSVRAYLRLGSTLSVISVWARVCIFNYR